MNELTRTPETVGAEIRGLTAQAKQMTLWFGIEIGRRLCEVKEMIGHGGWPAVPEGADGVQPEHGIALYDAVPRIRGAAADPFWGGIKLPNVE